MKFRLMHKEYMSFIPPDSPLLGFEIPFGGFYIKKYFFG